MKARSRATVDARRSGPPTARAIVAGVLLEIAGALAFSAVGADPLPVALDRHLNQPAFAQATWGVAVVAADSGEVLYATNAHKLLKPASTAKLFTGALVLDALGPDHRLRTDLVPTGPLTRHGHLHGDLLVHGRGDFSFAARFHQGDYAKSLEPIVDALRRAGVRHIDGAIVADDDHFSGPPFGTGWTWDDLQFYYGAEVGALNVDDNVIDLFVRPGAAAGDPVSLECRPDPVGLQLHLEGARTVAVGGPRRIEIRRAPGSSEAFIEGTLPVGCPVWTDAVSVPEPALHFAGLLRARLEAAGIPVRGGYRHERGAVAGRRSSSAVPRPALPAIAVESPPLAELVERMMKPSQNLYAQLLLLHAGAAIPLEPTAAGSAMEESQTSEERGVRALEAFTRRIGIPAGEVRLDDGSGLSRSALVTPDAQVRLLRYMDRSPARAAFLDSLPVEGVDRSLGNRFRSARAAGNVRAKTGSIRYVSTLAGYVTNAAGRPLVFSAMLNAYVPSAGAPSGRAAVDALVDLLIESPTPGSAAP